MENLERNCSYRIMFLFHGYPGYLSIQTGQIMPGGGDFVSFFRPGSLRFADKICSRDGDFDGKKLVARGLTRGDGNGSN